MKLDEIKDDYQEVLDAKVEEIAGLYDLGCSRLLPRRKSNNISDARWVVTWNVIQGNV